MSDAESAQQPDAPAESPSAEEPTEGAAQAESGEPAPEATPTFSLHIGNLRFETTEEMLREAFEKFGEVKSCRLIKYRDGRSKGYGFVDFVKEEDAEKAIEELNDKEFDGRVIRVGRANDRGSQDDQDRRPRRERRDRGGYDRGYDREYDRRRGDRDRDRDHGYGRGYDRGYDRGYRGDYHDRRSDRDRRY